MAGAGKRFKAERYSAGAEVIELPAEEKERFQAAVQGYTRNIAVIIWISSTRS